MIKIGSIEFSLFLVEGYNNPYSNERMIEIPLARWFIGRHNHQIVEIGAVMPYYDKVERQLPTDLSVGS
jgi:hypothetical protein